MPQEITFLFYISVQRFDPTCPKGGVLNDGYFGRSVHPKTMTEKEAKAEAKRLLDEANKFDPSYNGVLKAAKGKYRVRVRKVVEFKDTFIK